MSLLFEETEINGMGLKNRNLCLFCGMSEPLHCYYGKRRAIT